MIDVVNYKNSQVSISEVVSFFVKNDVLFVDPFSEHVDLSDYVEKLYQNGEIFLALDGTKICGMACAYMNDFRDNIAHLQVIVVSRAYQGRGIGGRLVDAVLYNAKNHGMAKCELTVDNENSEAINLYMRKGFVLSEKKHLIDTKSYMINAIEE